MKSLHSLALALLCLLAFGAKAADRHVPTEDEMSAYLFVFFSDPTHGLFMATSDDGYTFTALNDGKPIIAGDTIAEQKGVRDPHISRTRWRILSSHDRPAHICKAARIA